MLRKNAMWIAWLILAALMVGLLISQGAIGKVKSWFEPQFYVIVTLDQRMYIARLDGKFSKFSGCYELRDVYVSQPRDIANPKLGNIFVRRDHDQHWPWMTVVCQSQIEWIEPINRDSPFGKSIKDDLQKVR